MYPGRVSDKSPMQNRIVNTKRVQQLHALRHWERENLPHYGKEAGYALFLELAKADSDRLEALKEFYLSLPYSESTLRQLFRHLESDGWLEMPRKGVDRRIKHFVLTDKFHRKKDEWLKVVESILKSDGVHRAP
jgi:DNA-binding MarR family transcriptional regulator